MLLCGYRLAGLEGIKNVGSRFLVSNLHRKAVTSDRSNDAKCQVHEDCDEVFAISDD